LLVENIGVKEVVIRELCSVTGLEYMEKDPVEIQVGKIFEAIQQLQQRIAKLELQAVPSTPQEVKDLRE
jgi:hypothetical protein